MRIMVFVKATKESEAGLLPTRQDWESMDKFNEELLQAGISLVGEGLLPSSSGARVRFSGQGAEVTDGPFAETRELIAGYSIWHVSSMAEAIAWAKRCPLGPGSEIELRPIFCYSPEQVSQIESQPS